MTRFAAVVMLGLGGCHPSRGEVGIVAPEPDIEADTDTDTDSDADSDADADADGDADADADSDTDTATPADTGTGIGWPADIDIRVCADGSADHTEIQAAIDLSVPGDVIGVCPGTYGPISVPWSFDVAIRSLAGPDVTTIDGGADTAVLVIDGVLELTGFRVTGTGVDMRWSTDHGGAFTVEEGELTVRDCVVDGVTGPFALVFDEDLLVMEDVVWQDNATDMLWFLYQGTDATITRNTVSGGTHHNLITTIRLDALSLTHTVFSDITIDTAFTAFSLDTDGTGPLVLRNNVFHEIDDLDPWGGRLFSGEAQLVNNIVIGCDAWNLVPIDASYSVFWEDGVDYAPFVGGPGNLYVDPALVDPAAGDFGLQPGSPAIDAGDPRAFLNDPDGTRSDIGRDGGP